MRKQIGDTMIGGSDTELKVFEMKKAKRKESEIQAKIIYGSLIAVAGYFIYKKFKK